MNQKMKNSEKYVYFGLITVLIEWFGLIIATIIHGPLSLNQAISVATVSPQPLPIIFGIVLTLAGFTCFMFSLSLKRYSKYIAPVAFIGWLLFTLTGWLPYRGDNSSSDMFHVIFATSSILCYSAMIWLMRSHPVEKISTVSLIFSRLMIASIILHGFNMFVVQNYVAISELLLLFIAQSWILTVVWYSHKDLVASS